MHSIGEVVLCAFVRSRCTTRSPAPPISVIERAGTDIFYRDLVVLYRWVKVCGCRAIAEHIVLYWSTGKHRLTKIL